jgi:hypothetical protein
MMVGTFTFIETIAKSASTTRWPATIRGLEKKWNGDLREAMNEFIKELNERGYFQ